MKKKLIFITLVIAVVASISIWTVVTAAKPGPFSASGTVATISEGDVVAIGNSDRWIVANRELTGTLSGSISGDFTMTYGANVELETQAGNLYGTLETGPYVIDLEGEIEPLIQVGWVYWEVAPDQWDYMPKLKVKLSGQFTFDEGAKGYGDFIADIVFVPTIDGHVQDIFPNESLFTMSGKWHTQS